MITNKQVFEWYVELIGFTLQLGKLLQQLVTRVAFARPQYILKYVRS